MKAAATSRRPGSRHSCVFTFGIHFCAERFLSFSPAAIILRAQQAAGYWQTQELFITALCRSQLDWKKWSRAL